MVLNIKTVVIISAIFIIALCFYLYFYVYHEKFTSLNSCCGPITENGMKLAKILDSMDVEHNWTAGKHIDWITGKPDKPDDYKGPETATHCSAFAAAVGYKLNVYMLRPPEHPQELLSNAQVKWFRSSDGICNDWSNVNSFLDAQTLANQGSLVVIVYENPNPKKPGHIVVVRPSTKTHDELKKHGPQVIEATNINRKSYPAYKSFNAHPGAWPNNILMYSHDVKY